METIIERENCLEDSMLAYQANVVTHSLSKPVGRATPRGLSQVTYDDDDYDENENQKTSILMSWRRARAYDGRLMKKNITKKANYPSDVQGGCHFGRHLGFYQKVEIIKLDGN